MSRKLSISTHNGSARACHVEAKVTLDYGDMPPHPALVARAIQQAMDDLSLQVTAAMEAADASDAIFSSTLTEGDPRDHA